MSAPVSPRNSPKAATAPTDVDHRKRRRNRTTQSCLNCHATKRMCDRKRPCCTRCLQLGISGNCVYEVDDPNRQAGKQAEGSRLMNRITELEGVIRELKNKPQTRQERSPRADSPQSTPPNNSSWSSPTSTGYSSPGSQFPSAMTPSPPVPGYSRPSDSLASLIAAYAGLTDHMYVRRGGNCGCMTESACYNAVLELSLRLRKAADVLARSPSHSSHSDCPLNNHISDLDAFAKNSLLDIPSYDSSLMSGVGGGFCVGGGKMNPPSSPTIFNQTYAQSSNPAWNSGDADDFMSWVPTHRNL